MLLSIIAGMRAARRIGISERRAKAGDLEGVMKVCSEVLTILGAPKVDLRMPTCRSAASLALWGYCRAARQLERRSEIHQMLSRWRPRYLEWMKAPMGQHETDYLSWCEETFSVLSRDPQP
ncbi:hypothetical protein D7Y13_37775 [Corallococcus praedator]|uniref:Uncharacterized protein n=1 Tax=Corallococcus praedator TaxID=2316724 RepID=A0ABX9Q5H8_9BACT|nr:hypothetical protein D7X75_38585 [Corallococcus sp. CA031C]RKH92187.1 hypothetical protein D7Y13_37775 [Corallococcus praedator]